MIFTRETVTVRTAVLKRAHLRAAPVLRQLHGPALPGSGNPWTLPDRCTCRSISALPLSSSLLLLCLCEAEELVCLFAACCEAKFHGRKNLQ